MTAFYDFFRYIKLYSTDGTTLEATLEGDSVTDSLNISRGNGVAFTGANASTDSFKIDVDYDLNVPVSTTSIRLSDVNSNNKDIALVAGGNMTITRDNANQLTIAALVGGVSKSISAITQANPARVTTTNPHGFTEGTPVTIVDVVGMTNVNGNEYFMNVIDGNNFDLYTDDLLSTGLNSTGFPAYVSGGVATADYGGAKQAFKTIRVSGQTDVVADTIADLLTLVGGTGIDITTTAGTDTISYAIDSSVATLNDTQILTNKTLTTPVISSISNTGTITLPTSTDTLVGRATTDTFTNKSISLTTNTVTGTFAELNTAVSDETLVGLAATQTLTGKTLTDPILSPTATTGGKVEFLEGTNNGTNKATLIGPASTADVTITLPAATDTLVGKATTDTFTNKSISLTTNTVTGTLAELNTAVSDATLVGRDTTDTFTNKSISLTTNTLSGTFAELNTAITGDEVVGRATTDTLTNKTLTNPILSPTATTGGKIEFLEGTNNGTHKITLQAPASVTGARFITFPDAGGTVPVSVSSPLSLSGLTGNITFDWTIGTNLQAWDADLDALAGLTSAADTGIYFTGSNTAGTFTLGSIGRTFLGATNVGNAAGSQRKLLGVDNDDNVQMGSIGIGTAASGTAGEIRATNNITGYYTSDSRLKENIVNIPNALDRVAKLKGVRFDWCDSYIEERGGEDGYFIKKHDTGLIAQDVLQVLPEVVREKKDGYLGIQYDKLVGLLVEAIKELRKEVNELKSKG
jgi:hypothetical protein